MFCPILAAAKMLANREVQRVRDMDECYGNACAWWNEGLQCCAILTIAKGSVHGKLFEFPGEDRRDEEGNPLIRKKELASRNAGAENGFMGNDH